MKKFMRISLLSLAMLTVTLLLLEAMVRIAGIAPAGGTYEPVFDRGDDALPWRDRPNVVEKSQTSEFTVTYKKNSLGFNDREHSVEKKPGVFRIVAIGDSFTFGHGVEAHQNFPFILEKDLNSRASKKRFEVINLGQRGYWPALEFEILKRYGLKYSPDLVVLSILSNDLYDYEAEKSRVVVDGVLVSRSLAWLGTPGVRLHEYSHTFRLLVTALQKPANANGLSESSWNEFFDDIEKIRSALDSKGVRLVIVAIPSQGEWSADSGTFKTLTTKIKETGFHLVDMQPAVARYVGAGHKVPYFRIDGHFDVDGYELLGREIAGEIWQGLKP